MLRTDEQDGDYMIHVVSIAALIKKTQHFKIANLGSEKKKRGT